MKSVINLYKPVGMTPLQAVEKFKKQNLRYKKEKISYPGRLDPMAQGILLLLVGDENKEMRTYMGLDKEYRAKILLDFNSDTYDILGLAVKNSINILETEKIKKIIKEFKGRHNQKLPAYSSYRIKGKSLFSYARKGKLSEIKIPEKEVLIKSIKINSIYQIGSGKLLKEIVQKIEKVNGDFRQKETLVKWNELLKGKEEKYLVVDVTIGCSSGTYIRAIANEVGEKLGGGGLLLNLIRTRVGKFGLASSRRFK